MRIMRAFKRLAALVLARGGIVLFFIMALEVMIMISPFAFFFYSVFNPALHWLGRYPATRWLTDFFLPHMILPPTHLLQGIRILGSVLFVAGCLLFIICALQVYLGKILQRGVAARGLYAHVRHPQYLSLALWGLGMSILWPRFIVLVTLSVMCVLYYWLARDEERRMMSRFGDSYALFRESRGMFLPRSLESRLARGIHGLPRFLQNPAAGALVVIALVVGTGFLCREITLRSLLYTSADHITVVPILPEDRAASARALAGITRDRLTSGYRYLDPEADYLGYVMPPDYIMQGMIADTGEKAHLFKHHNTLNLITDWVLHPFAHLRRPASTHMARMHHVDPVMARRHHCPLGLDEPTLDCAVCPYRRVILVRIDHQGRTHLSGKGLLGIGLQRIPVAVVDVDTRSGKLIDTIKVGAATAWRDVPTPAL
jgi:protein-S-isoprenylcysteine O-methyltransferase Ste14